MKLRGVAVWSGCWRMLREENNVLCSMILGPTYINMRYMNARLVCL